MVEVTVNPPDGTQPPPATYDPRSLGALCDSCSFNTGHPVPHKPAVHTRLIVLCEAPGESEVESLEPLTGQTGQLFDRLCRNNSLQRDELHLTNAVKCRSKYKATPAEWATALKCCEPLLANELRNIDCNWILAMGNKALAITVGAEKITDWVGAPAEAKRLNKATGRSFHVLPSYHPSFVLPHRRPALKPVVTEWIGRAVAYAEGRIAARAPRRIVTSWNSTEAQILEAIKRLHDAPRLSPDVETAELDKQHPESFERVVNTLYDVGIGSARLGLAVSVYWPTASERVRDAMRELHELPIPKVMMNGMHDVMTFNANGIVCEAYTNDLLVADRWTAPGHDHGLSFQRARDTPYERWKEIFRGSRAKAFSEAIPAIRSEYNATDCLEQDDQADIQDYRIRHLKHPELYDLAMDNWRTGIRMRQFGIRCNRNALATVRKPLRHQLAVAKVDLLRIAQEHGFKSFASTNNDHIRSLFEDKLKVNSHKRTPSGEQFSYDKEALGKLEEHADPRVRDLARKVRVYREAQKLYDYVQRPPTWSDNRFRGGWNMQSTITRRNTCEGDPLQRLPKKNKLGKEIRKIYAPDEGCFAVRADFSQQEPRFSTLFANIPQLLEVYNRGGDAYQFLAHKIFQKPMAEVAKGTLEREMSKSTALSFMYGASAQTAWIKLLERFPNASLMQVTKARATFFAEFPGFMAYHRFLEREMLLRDRVVCPLNGDERIFYGAPNPNEAFNDPNQRAGGFLMAKAVRELNKLLNWRDEALVSVIHDEVWLQGRDLPRLIDAAKIAMEQTIHLDGRSIFMPIEIIVSTKSFGEGLEYKGGDVQKFIEQLRQHESQEAASVH